MKSSLAFRAVSGHGVWSGRCGEGEGGSGQFDAERLSRVRCLRRSMQCTCLRLVLDRSLGACNRCRGSTASGLHRAWRLSRSKLGQRLGRLGVGLACQCHTRFRLRPSRSDCGSHAPPCVLQQSQRQAGGGQASWPRGGGTEGLPPPWAASGSGTAAPWPPSARGVLGPLAASASPTRARSNNSFDLRFSISLPCTHVSRPSLQTMGRSPCWLAFVFAGLHGMQTLHRYELGIDLSRPHQIV